MFIDPVERFPGKVLVIAPHMDDEMLACGGTMALLPDKQRIHLIYATDGMKSPAPIVPWRDAITADLGETRVQEAREALELIGVPSENAHFLRLPEAELQQHKEDLRHCLNEQIEQIKPDFIFIPFRYDRHPDHLAINHVVTNAHRQLKWQSQISEYFVYYRWRLLPAKDVRLYVKPKHLLEVDTSEVADEKRAALDCFRSQTTHFYDWQTRPILTPMLLEDTSKTAELFLLYDSHFPGASIFSKSVPWIRFVHRAEPFLQKSKYLVGANLKRLISRDNNATG
jgi:LmbE family N-acetylglucosaminyl deacetylase